MFTKQLFNSSCMAVRFYCSLAVFLSENAIMMMKKKIIMKCRRRGQNDRDLSYSQPFVRQISYIFNGQALIQTGLRECVLVYFRCGPYLPWRSYVCWTERAAGALCRCRTPQRPEQLLTNGKRKKRGKADEPVLLEGSWNSLCSCFYHQCSKGKTALFSHGYWLLTRPVKGYLSARYKVWGFNIQSLGTLFHCQLFLLPLRPLPWGQLHSAALNVLQPPLLLKSELQKMQLGTEKSLFWSGTREGGRRNCHWSQRESGENRVGAHNYLHWKANKMILPVFQGKKHHRVQMVLQLTDPSSVCRTSLGRKQTWLSN